MRVLGRGLSKLGDFFNEFRFASANSPVFFEEARFWRRQIPMGWRLEEIFGILAIISFSVLPVTILFFPQTFLAHFILVEGIGLIVSVPASLCIVREREGQTWDILRTTQLSGVEIVAGKLAGIQLLIRDGVKQLVMARMLCGLLVSFLVGAIFVWFGSSPFQNVSHFILLPWASLLAALFFFLRPILNTWYSLGLGLAISTTASSRPRALYTLGLVQFAVITIAAGIFFEIYRGNYLDLALAQNVAGTRLTSLLIWLFPMLIVTLIRMFVTLACILWSVRQIDKSAF